MMHRSIPVCLVVTLFSVGCGPADDEGTDTHSGAQLGDYSANHRRSCDDRYPPVIEDMVFAMRVTAASPDFEGQLNTRFRDFGYWPHDRDPYKDAGTMEQRGQGLRVSRSVNPLEVRCRNFIAGGHGRANTLKHNHGGYFKEKVKLDDDGGSLYEGNRSSFVLRTGTIFHETLHNHGYKHRAHHRTSYDHSMPQVTRHSMQFALWAADDVAGTTAPSRTLDCAAPPCPVADTMREYRDLGYLVFQKSGETQPRYMFDPARRGLGAMQYNTVRRSLELQDAQLHGQRYRRTASIEFSDTWVGSPDDEVLLSGNLLPGSQGGEFLLRVDDGIVAVGWAPGAPSNFRQLRRSRWGDVLPSSRGPAWTLSLTDRFIGITDVRLRPSRVPTPPDLLRSKEIVVQGSGGIAFLSAAFFPAPSMNARATVAVGTTLEGANTSWRFESDARVLAVGDFTGNGFKDNVLVADGAGLAVIRHSIDGAGRSGPVRLSARHLGAKIGGWTWDADTTVVAVGDFDADGADEWVARNGKGIAIFGLTERTSSSPGFARLAQAFWGGFVFGQSGDELAPFKLSSTDQIMSGRVMSDNRAYLIFNGDRGLAVSWVQGGILRTGDSARILEISTADTHSVDVVADLDGDGFDELFVTSPRSSRIIERNAGRLQIQSQSVRWSNCDAKNESCHGSLWGQWMVRNTDEAVGAIPDGNGGYMLLAINRGAP